VEANILESKLRLTGSVCSLKVNVMRKNRPIFLLISVPLLLSLSACSQLAIATPPDVEFQDVSRSLSTVNPDDHLHLFEYDRSLPLDIQEVRSWRRNNVTVTELTYASPRGEPVPTLLFEPDGEGPFAGVILMHGAPGQKEMFNDLGVEYASYGFVAIAIDAPQFRSSHNVGHFTMAIMWPRFDEKDHEEQTQLILDLQRAVDVLLTREKVDPERLTYIGGSYGGAVGGLFAGAETRLKAYVLKVGDGGILEHMSEPDDRGMPVTLERWVNILWPVEPIHYVGRAAPAELLFQNGVTDEYVPASDSLRYQQAASEPKTVIWYNTGHFLPQRHYYDHLIWQHEHVGVDSILLKPLFAESSMVYDRLLLLWFTGSGLCLLMVIWEMARKPYTGWLEALAWSMVILTLGPVGLAARWIIKRVEAEHDGPTPGSLALSAALWIVPVTMIGAAFAQQIIFISVFTWRIKLGFFFYLPQVVALFALGINYVVSKGRFAGLRIRISIILPYVAVSTFITIIAFMVNDWLSRVVLHFGFPIYNPLKWFVLMLAGISAVILAHPFLYLLSKRGFPLWGMPPIREHPVNAEHPGFRWYTGLLSAIGTYTALFLIQGVYVTFYTPGYVKYIDALKLMLGFE
jgi:dienelactone hydrolase